jgi:hypothetical protein
MGPMPENSAAPNQGPAIDHELWLAMQAAHDRYKNTSATLDALTAMSPAGNSSPECRLAIDAAAAEQRAAFESYIEARLELSESMVSGRAGPPLAEEDTKRGAAPFWRNPRMARAVLVGVTAAALLLPATFRVGYLEGERREARDIETARDGADAMLMLMSSQVDPPPRKDASKTAPPAARVGSSDIARADAKKAAPPTQMAPRKPARTGKIAKNHQELHELQKRGERNYYEFLFTPWKQTERIGRIRLTVLKVVPGQGFSDISIAVDNLAPNRKRVSLNEPVWIDLTGRPKAVELVVNQIDGNRVGGYLSEPKYPRLSWRREPDLASLATP